MGKEKVYILPLKKTAVCAIIMSPFEEEGAYCFANVGRSVCPSYGRPNILCSLS